MKTAGSEGLRCGGQSRKKRATNWSGHKDARQGAVLAYYSVFSLGPIIVIAIAIAGLFFSHEGVTSQVTSSMKEMVGETGAKAIEAMLAAANQPAEGALATILGIGALLFAAIGVVVQLKDALNVVWEVEESKETGLWHFARNYVLSLAAVLALGFLLLVSLLVTTALAAVGKFAAPYLPEGILHVVNMLVSFAVVTILFAMMFKWLPDVSVGTSGWAPSSRPCSSRWDRQRSASTSESKAWNSTYGAAASIVVLLIWVYYTSQVVLMGAEVSHAYANHAGSIRQRRSRNRRGAAVQVAAGRAFGGRAKRAF